MNVERFTRGELARYRIHSYYDGGSIAIEPKALMALLRWLQEHENEIVQDVIHNAGEEQDYDPAILDERNPFTPPESELYPDPATGLWRVAAKQEPPVHDDIHRVEAYRRAIEQGTHQDPAESTDPAERT